MLKPSQSRRCRAHSELRQCSKKVLASSHDAAAETLDLQLDTYHIGRSHEKSFIHLTRLTYHKLALFL